jgi:hypothetical protein
MNSNRPGLPTFTWYSIPKRGKIYPRSTKIDHKIHISNDHWNATWE